MQWYLEVSAKTTAESFDSCMNAHCILAHEDKSLMLVGVFCVFCPVFEMNNISTEPKKKTVSFSCKQLVSVGVTLISDEFTVINANTLALLTVCRPLADFWPQQCCYWSATLIVFLVFVETIPLFADIPPPAGWHWTCVGLSTHGTEG